jgi:hypothetical protein
MSAREWRHIQERLWFAASHLRKPALATASAEAGEVAAELEAKDAKSLAAWNEAVDGIERKRMTLTPRDNP